MFLKEHSARAQKLEVLTKKCMEKSGLIGCLQDGLGLFEEFRVV